MPNAIRLLGTLLLCCLLFCGCHSVPDPLSRMRSPFSATLCGTRGDLCWEAELTVEPTCVTLRYTAPESLAGLVLTKTGETLIAKSGDVVYRATPDALEGLWLPAMLLTEFPSIASQEQRSGTTEIDFSDGSVLFLDESLAPARANHPDLTVFITGFRGEE